MRELLAIQGLRAHYLAENGEVAPVLCGVDLTIGEGEVVGLLGESGCGKTTLARCIVGLLPEAAQIGHGRILFEGRDLLRATADELRGIRGAKISTIPQEPGMALCPVVRVGQQIVEVLAAHNDARTQQNRAAAHVLLAEVGFRETERIFAAYPHQLSGGQLQRVVIAQALACRPKLVIADEPTASLDAASREEVLTLLRWAQKSRNLSMLLISHQPAVMRKLANRIAVMHEGEIVEEGRAGQVLAYPRHAYAQALVQCGREGSTHAIRA